MKLMILDGNSIINRAFYGIRMLNASDGTPTNAVYGFLSTFRRVFDLAQPQAVCVAFDVHAPTFRHEQYALYKAQRKPMPEELAVQMPLLKQTLDYMGVRRLELAGWEADDLLGTVARRCEAAGWTCDVVTGDKDSLQLITDSTHVFNVKTRMGQTETIEYTPERFREEYGFDPIRMIDLKALMGDSSDNIPGVPGIGEKTAKDLLVRFGTVADIYRDLDALDIKPGVRAALVRPCHHPHGRADRLCARGGRRGSRLSAGAVRLVPEAQLHVAVGKVWAAAGGRCKRTVERAAGRGRGGQRRAARA